jgi:hypothetical protein
MLGIRSNHPRSVKSRRRNEPPALEAINFSLDDGVREPGTIGDRPQMQRLGREKYGGEDASVCLGPGKPIQR